LASEVAIVGGGPAGLIAAERLSAAGARVTVYDRMPSVGRKLLMAGRGGLNLTHSEPLDAFVARYGEADHLDPLIDAFPPAALVQWAEDLGQETFVGSSGRVFPRAMKASPLLRAWLARLAAQGVQVRTRSTWRGWTIDGALRFDTPDGEITQAPERTLLALGGASWPGLGSDGAWTPLLAERGVELSPFRPANAGVNVAWTEHMREHFAGEPVKGVALSFSGRRARGEMTISRYGLEGGAIYAMGGVLREHIDRVGAAVLHVDLRPDVSLQAVYDRLADRRPGQSTANLLRRAGLTPAAASFLREAAAGPLPSDPEKLARLIKDAPIRLTGVQPLARAISSAGGVAWSSVDERLQLRALPSVFVAGEMLDWEAPTGGYLLQACLASGRAAALGALVRLAV
jgi:uncharacterized flavoprotein (TIGR03862 family)